VSAAALVTQLITAAVAVMEETCKFEIVKELPRVWNVMALVTSDWPAEPALRIRNVYCVPAERFERVTEWLMRKAVPSGVSIPYAAPVPYST
jgi:hypothetical protein